MTIKTKEGMGGRSSLPEGEGSVQKRRSWVKRRNLPLLLFVLPGLAVYLGFLVLPTLGAFVMSFTNWDGVSNSFQFVGVDNYQRALTEDPIFRQSVIANVKFTLTILICQTVLSLGLALLLVKNTRLNIFYRALFFFPTVIASVSIGLAWVLMYDPNIGALNIILERIGLSMLTQSWLGDRGIAIFSVAVVQFWMHTGQVMIIFIAGLQAIPKELYESVALDGARRWQTFRHLTLPLLAPAAAIVIAYTTIQTFRAFDLILTLTGGGPSYATEIFPLWIYHTAFQDFTFGYASAGAVLFLIALAGTTWLQFRITRVEQ